MLSFAGVPLTMGFWGKFYLFRTAVQAGNMGLALIGLLTSVVSAYYYLRVIVYMFMKPGDRILHINQWVSLVLAITALAVVILAIFPGMIFEWASQAVMLIR
jgi:NADH-quinone oxidoreductase subunit N